MKKQKLEKKTKTKGLADDVDKHVGNRLRIRRSLLGLSQEKLAECVGVTFQQVQKYERGANRISSSRLLSFSKLLDVPLSYFFDGLEDNDSSKSSALGFAEDKQEGFDHGSKKIREKNLFTQKETIELMKAYYAVQDTKLRKEILKIVRSMSKNMS